jgi:hypothetical protein
MAMLSMSSLQTGAGAPGAGYLARTAGIAKGQPAAGADDFQLLGFSVRAARLAALRRFRLSLSAVASRWALAVAGVFGGASGSGRLGGSFGRGAGFFDSSIKG